MFSELFLTERGQLNTQLWNTGSEVNKEIARKQKRKLSFIANILIVSDPKHPENEGKVFLFKFGKKIFDKIMDKAKPTYEDEQPINIFDFDSGANFKLRMRKKDGYTNYDESTFQEPSPIGSDEEIARVLDARYKLSQFLDRKHFKTYEELKRKLEVVLSGDSFSGKSAAEIAKDEDRPVAAVPQPRSAEPAVTPKSKPAPSIEDDDDDVMSYFEKIAREE